HARARRDAALREPLDDGGEQAGRRGEVAERALGVAELLAQALVGGGLAIVAVDVVEGARDRGEGLGIRAAVVPEALAHAFAQLLEIPARARDAEHRHPQASAPHQALERRIDLLVGEITAGSEQDQRVGCAVAHVSCPEAAFSRWPPNANRIAEST